MKVIQCADANAGSRAAFDLLAQELKAGAKVWGLATGSTPLGLYQDICASDLDLTSLTSINLDEYVGIPADNPQSYHYFMRKHLFNAKPFKQSFLPDGTNLNTEEVTQNYERLLRKYPIDVQILGIGRNGHIGFNEPGTGFDSKTHKVKLTPSTIKANARFFTNPAKVPQYAYTMGIGSIMQAKKIILLAFGASKADAIDQAVQGTVTTAVPASVLQNHPNVTVIVDKAASAKLK